MLFRCCVWKQNIPVMPLRRIKQFVSVDVGNHLKNITYLLTLLGRERKKIYTF